jgi:mycothiol synthase
MSDSQYTIRNYQPSDFKQYVKFINRAEKLEPSGRLTSEQEITQNLKKPNYSPEQDLFLVETGGDIVGYMDIMPERTIKRAILYCWIHPQHRRKGLATKLLDFAMRRAKESGAEVVHVNISRDNNIAIRVLEKLYFNCVRRYFELRLDIDKVERKEIDRAVQECRHLRSGEEASLTDIQNRSFADTWGYNPNTVEEIVYKVNLGKRSPEDVVLAYDGDKVVGFCWIENSSKKDAASGKLIGRILMIGTDPEYQGKGVGEKTLLAGLGCLKKKKHRFAELAVDSENKAAIALYQSIGFKARTISLWYEKAVD